LGLLYFCSPGLAADGAPSLEDNQRFLAANSHKPGVMTRPSGLQYRILRNGLGRHPTIADSVEVSYSGTLINGRLVDRTSTDLPAILPISTALRGLSEALQMMQVGDRWELVLPSDIALGSKGTANGVIPPNQTLIFDISLLAIIPPSAGTSESASPLSLFGRERGKDTEAGAMLRISP
jgi:FKBP-type peptidyl-prolyl cis-trans isomerase